ncbi:uncharacterized protein JCM6883_003903 [Sporobolomyces salmoneus]|uniref:uncharacterized protein n=1 Tax=Sporobolomyces salmoneus TaxID=183962 RepID=UPI00317ACE54
MHRVPPPLGDTLSFPSNRSLLQPKFESYKLALPSSSVSRSTSYPLPTPFETRALDDGVRLSFAEVQSRAKHNHLARGKGGELVWIEKGGKVRAAKVDGKTASLSIHDVVQLPKPSPSSSTSPDVAPAYPVAIALSFTQWIVSNGLQELHLLTIDPSTLKGHLESTFTISPSSLVANRPLHLHRADISPSNPDQALVLLSVAKKESNSNPKSQDPLDTDQPKLGAAQSRLKIPSTTSFEYFLVKIQLSREGGGGGELNPEWIVKGDDLPAFVHFDSEGEGGERYCIGSSSALTTIDTPHAPTEFPSTEIDQEMTKLEGTDPSQLPSTPSVSIPKPPPFSWSQDSASLTVAFPIPSTTPTSSIRITFSKLYLTLHIASPSSAVQNSIPLFNLPRISHKKWWGEIDPHTSVWTFDREAEGRDSNFGILTLHLEKQFAGTKWSDVFATTSRPEGDGQKIVELNEEWEYEEVSETVDPSELAKISEEMEKWTRGIMEGGGGVSSSNEGLGHGVPTSLMGDEMDVEIDADSGRSIVVSWIEAKDSQKPRIVTPHPSVPYSLLSTPLPFSRSSSTSRYDSSITIKHDVDGLLFISPSSGSDKSYQWTHTSTFPALAFVLATKRDTKFVLHHLDKFALAFDSPPLQPSTSSGSSRTEVGGGNLFVYFLPGGKETKGKQLVLKVGTASSGSVMGVAGVELEGGEIAIVALCEREIVVLRLN